MIPTNLRVLTNTNQLNLSETTTPVSTPPGPETQLITSPDPEDSQVPERAETALEKASRELDPTTTSLRSSESFPNYDPNLRHRRGNISLRCWRRVVREVFRFFLRLPPRDLTEDQRIATGFREINQDTTQNHFSGLVILSGAEKRKHPRR